MWNYIPGRIITHFIANLFSHFHDFTNCFFLFSRFHERFLVFTLSRTFFFSFSIFYYEHFYFVTISWTFLLIFTISWAFFLIFKILRTYWLIFTISRAYVLIFTIIPEISWICYSKTHNSPFRKYFSRYTMDKWIVLKIQEYFPFSRFHLYFRALNCFENPHWWLFTLPFQNVKSGNFREEYFTKSFPSAF